MDSERSKIIRAKKDIKYFDSIYDKYYPKINNFVFHRVKDESICNEIVSNVFFKAMKRLSIFRFYNSRYCGFSSWLYRIALSELNQYFHERKREKIIQKNYKWNTPKGQSIKMNFEEIEKLIQELKLDEQNLIALRFYEKLSYREIGEILKKNEGAVKVKMHRIMNKLRNKLTQEINYERS
ncbi:MAG: sigma-70 family RNA polymerase sigma factor [Candidatus Cloacimonetes bacterium]|nr:sigma-70 family RNA polymerase sigma factor [Candidatus Cloacimonadota bacterium]